MTLNFTSFLEKTKNQLGLVSQYPEEKSQIEQKNPLEQIKYWQEQSEAAKKKQRQITTWGGALQTFGESTIVGKATMALGNYGYSLMDKESPRLKQEDITTNKWAQLGIGAAGFLSDLAIVGAITSPIVTASSKALLTKAGMTNPLIQRAITYGAAGFTKFGARGSLYEAADQLVTGNFSPLKIAQEGGRLALFGTATSTLPMTAGMGVSKLGYNPQIIQSISGGLVFSGWTAMERLFTNGQITKEDIPALAINFALGATLEYISSNQMSNAYKTEWLKHQQNDIAIKTIQNNLKVDQQTAIRLHDLNNKAEVLRIISGNNATARSVANKLKIITGEFKPEHLVKTPGGLESPTALKKIDLKNYFTSTEKLLLEQLNMYSGPTPETPIITPDKPALVREMKTAIPRLSDSIKFLSPQATGSPVALNFKIGDLSKIPTALDMLKNVQQGISLEPIKLDESLGDTLQRWTTTFKDVPAGLSIKAVESEFPEFEGFDTLTTKVLDKLTGRSIVSKQFISDLTNSPDLKQVERNMIRDVLDSYDVDKIPVKEFANKVKDELLPLKMTPTLKYADYNYIPDAQKGKIANASTHIWESPIKTSAGGIHFGGEYDANIDNYFGHVRVEDMTYGEYGRAGKSYAEDMLETYKDNYDFYKKKGDKFNMETELKGIKDLEKQIVEEKSLAEARTTRRITEVQSDLYQKGALEDKVQQMLPEAKEVYTQLSLEKADRYKELQRLWKEDELTPELIAERSQLFSEAKQNFAQKSAGKLQQYNDPTAHFRMVREEIKLAAIDGKTKLQFPTGETAMKIEGLGEASYRWYVGASELTPEKLEVGLEISSQRPALAGDFTKHIITDVLGDGKFKAVPSTQYNLALHPQRIGLNSSLKAEGYEKLSDLPKVRREEFIKQQVEAFTETFDISGKVDTSNPIYRFYEKTLGKYLQNKYGAQRITDTQGIDWWEIDIKPDMGRAPVEAYKTGPGNYIYNITPAKADELLKQIFSDEEVQFLTAKRLQTSKGITAYGLYGDQIIQAVEHDGLISDFVLFHEAFHAYLDLFKKPDDKYALLAEYRDKHNLKTTAEAEEKIADLFAMYLSARQGPTSETLSSALVRLFQDIIYRVRTWLGLESKLMDLFKDIERVERPDSELQKEIDAERTREKQRIKYAGVEEQPTPKELEPLAKEAMKYNSAEEFVSNSIKTTKDNIPLINSNYFKSYPLAQNKIQIIDIEDLNNISMPANRDVVLQEIKEQGLIPPIVDGYDVIDGNHRVAVLQELGFKKIPVIDDADAWVQDADTYGQYPWVVPEGESIKVKSNPMVSKLIDYKSANKQLTTIYNQVKGVGVFGESKLGKPEVSGIIPEELHTEKAKQLRQRISALAISKEMSKTEFNNIKRQYAPVVGTTKEGKELKTTKLTRMNEKQLEKILDAIQGERPKRVGWKTVITKKTENKIQELRENLKTKLQMTDVAYANILRSEGLIDSKTGAAKDPVYIDRQHFITESQGQSVLKRMLDESLIVKQIESFNKAVREKPDIQKHIAIIDNRIDSRRSKGVRDPGRLESMRYYNQQAELKTGAPFYTIYQNLIDTNSVLSKKRTDTLKDLEALVPKFKDIAGDEKSLERVSHYIASKSKLLNRPVMPKDITDSEIKVAKGIEDILKSYEYKIRTAKFYNWYYFKKPIADYEQHKSDIDKAVDTFETQGHDEVVELLKTQSWGIIKGGYEPLQVAMPSIKQYRFGPTAIGKGHIQIRLDLEYHPQDKNILQRLSSYMRQIDMLFDMQPKIQSMVRLYDDNLDKFKEPRKVKESIETFLRTLKGYNVSEGFFGEMLSRLYSQAVKTVILPSPALVVRNLLQNLGFEHDKTILIDPRNHKLTEEDIEYIDTYVLQSKQMMEDWFMSREKPLPGLGWLTGLIDKVKIYPYSDVVNRYWGFWAKKNQVDRALKNDNIDKVMSESNFDDMSLLEQKTALRILARDGKEAMSRYVARVHVDDIHFLYAREERSPAEMGPLGTVIGNLMLFPRAYWEKLTHAGSKLMGKDNTAAERARGFKIILAVVAGGLLVGEMYKRVTGRTENPYNPLSLLAYQPGGLMTGVIALVGDVYSDMISAAAGDKKALGALAIAIPRSADMFIPLYSYLVRGLEASTDMKNVDRMAIRKIRELLDEEYKVRGDAYQVERNAIDKWRYFLAGAGIDYTRQQEAIEEKKQREKAAFKSVPGIEIPTIEIPSIEIDIPTLEF
jgi:hypothetical protein